MAVFVILALALLGMAVGAAVVAALQVGRAARRGRTAVETTRDRLRPLAEELEAELAVTGTEMDAIGQRVSAFSASRQSRARGRGKRRGD